MNKIFYVGKELDMRFKYFIILMDHYNNDLRAEYETRRLVDMHEKKKLNSLEGFKI